MLLLNEYHEDISKLHVNMMERRSYYVPFVNTIEAINVKNRNKQKNFFSLNGKWEFNYFDSLQLIKEFNNINEIYEEIREGNIPIIIDEKAEVIKELRPDVVVDAIIAKKNLGTSIEDAPIVIGVGIGGTFDKAAYLAKKALIRPLNKRNDEKFYSNLEEELLETINKLGIGPQGFGGKTTALGLNIETYPTHIAGLPIAVNINCHATRHKEREI